MLRVLRDSLVVVGALSSISAQSQREREQLSVVGCVPLLLTVGRGAVVFVTAGAVVFGHV